MHAPNRLSGPNELERRQKPERPGLKLGVRDVLPVLASFWVVSVILVIWAIVHDATFGPELTLILAAVVGVPVLLLGPLRRRPRVRERDK